MILPADQLGRAKKWDGSNPKDLVEIFKSMEKICLENQGVGLAGVQIGVDLDIFIVKKGENSFFDAPFGWFVNTNYEPTYKSKRVKSKEGCLSIKNSLGELVFYEVNRYDQIQINGFIMKEDGSLQEFKLNISNQSFIFQHEIDHNHNILISQIGEEI